MPSALEQDYSFFQEGFLQLTIKIRNNFFQIQIKYHFPLSLSKPLEKFWSFVFYSILSEPQLWLILWCMSGVEVTYISKVFCVPWWLEWNFCVLLGRTWNTESEDLGLRNISGKYEFSDGLRVKSITHFYHLKRIIVTTFTQTYGCDNFADLSESTW